MGKQEEGIGGGLERSSETKFYQQKSLREKGMGGGGVAADIVCWVWGVAGEGTDLWIKGRGLRWGLQTCSSSLRRVIRWKGRIRKDLRERRWQMGSLSSFSKTSRKLLLLFLQGSKPLVRRDVRGLGGHRVLGSGGSV